MTTTNKQATKRTTNKGKKGTTPEAVQATTNEARTFTVRFVEALTLRNAEQYSKDTDLSISNAQRASVALDMVFALPAFSEIADDLIRKVRIASDKQNRADFIAVKVPHKIIDLCESIATGLSSSLNGYSRTIFANLCKLNGITNKSNLVALSKSVEYDALDQVQALKGRYNCSVGTASSQAGQVRMVALHMGIADVRKGKRGDVMTLQANERAQALLALFTDKVIAEEQEPASE